MGIPLRVLIVEDSEDDVRLLARELKRGGYEVTHEQVDTAPAMQAALDAVVPDVFAMAREAMVRKFQAGHVTGGRVFGYDNVRATSHTERRVNLVEASVIRRIFELAAAGVPVGVMVAPIIPGLTDHEMPAILAAG